LTDEDLRRLAAALRAIGYRGGMALELNRSNPDPEGALSEGRAIIAQAFAG
jgi:hypothetical protein